MFSREAIDQKYKHTAKEQGVLIETLYQSELPKKQEIEGTGGQFTVKLNSDQISEADYETYLSYHVRKIILPRLRLETERLSIRPFERKDSQEYFALFSDERSAYMDSGLLFASADEEYERLMDAFEAQTRFSIVQKETGRIVGTICLLDVNDRAVETMETGYGIFPVHQRCGYAYEALSTLLHYLLYDLNLDMVIAGAFPDNEPNQGLLKKLGFQYEGRRHKAFWNELRGPLDLQYYYLEKSAGKTEN